MKLEKNMNLAATFIAAILFITACGQNKPTSTKENMTQSSQSDQSKQSVGNIDTATFGAGCFWCVEAVFQRLNGVLSVKSGYSGGNVKNPSYKEVCNGSTGHAEVCQIIFDKNKIHYEELLEVFWKTHDPTTMNSQGNDFGTQYRSVIFYHHLDQKQLAEKYKSELNAAKVYDNPIVTEIAPLTNYYPAEDYHQNYFNQNGSEGYCKFVIQPKVEKFEKVFKQKLKH